MSLTCIISKVNGAVAEFGFEFGGARRSKEPGIALSGVRFEATSIVKFEVVSVVDAKLGAVLKAKRLMMVKMVALKPILKRALV